MKNNLLGYLTENKVYGYLLFFTLSIWLLLIIRFIAIGGASVSEIDEVPYFNSSKVFAREFSLMSTEVIEEEVSQITESDWYGPGYPLIYGSFRILLGNTDKSFIYSNLAFIFVVLVIIGRFGFDIIDRKWLWLIVLLCPSIINYVFMFMPVTLDLLFACILMFILAKINSLYPGGNIKSLGFVFLLAVLLASLVKQNFLFFSFGLLFFSKNRKWFFIWLFVIIVLFLVVMKYNSYFLAPAYADNLKKSITYLGNLQIKKFLSEISGNFIINLLQFKSRNPVALVYLVPFYLVLLPLFTAVLNLKLKDRMVFAIAAISGFTLLSYLMFYTTDWVYFIRISIPLVFVNCFSILFFKDKLKAFFKYTIIVSFVISMSLTVNEVIKNQDIKKRNYEYVNYEMPDFRQIALFLEKNKINTILIDADFYKIYGFEQFLVALPIEYDNNIIRYTVNYRLRNKFELLHKIKVDYALTVKPEDIPNTALVNKTEYYYLYKFTN